MISYKVERIESRVERTVVFWNVKMTFLLNHLVMINAWADTAIYKGILPLYSYQLGKCQNRKTKWIKLHKCDWK